MGMLVLGGPRANALEFAKSVTMTSEHGVHAKEFLFDGRSSKKAQFLTNAADLAVTVDLDQLENGGFEGGISDVTNESTGTGTIAHTVTAGEFDAGTGALKVTAGAGGSDHGIAKLIVTVAAGQHLSLILRTRSQTTSQTGRIRVYNPRTGKYLTSGLVWSASESDLATNTVATFTTKGPYNFQVESVNLVQELETPLWIYLRVSGPDNGWASFDQVSLSPRLNHCSVHYHNIAPAIAPLFQSSPDNSAWTTEATLFPYKPAFYGSVSTPTEERYARFRIPGTNHVTPWAAELVMGYAVTLARNFNYDPTYAWNGKNVIAETPRGDVWSMSQGDPTRRLQLQFTETTQAQFDEFLQEVFLRARGRRYPLVVVPDTDRPEVVVHGWIQDEQSANRPYVTFYNRIEVTLDEGPGPIEVL